MSMEILEAFRVLGVQGTIADVLEAGRRLFIRSDPYKHAERRFDNSEVDAVARAICEYLEDPKVAGSRYIALNDSRSIRGVKMEICAFAATESQDMLYQNGSWDFAALDLDDLRGALQQYLLAILFRYQFCVDEDRAVFPISEILQYLDGIRHLMCRENRQHEFTDGLLKTLEALRSLEPIYRWRREVGESLQGRARRVDPITATSREKTREAQE